MKTTFQRVVTPDYLLNPKQIDIYQWSLSDYASNALGLLSDEEIQRAERFVFEKHRIRFIAAHAQVKTILSRYLNLEPHHLIIDKLVFGKPVIYQKDIEFNLSHSQDLALLAVGQHAPLGIDLEFFSDRSLIDIAENAFSKPEIECLEQAPTSLQALLFFSIWAQKEAFIKASGLGLRYPTQEFTVSLDLPPTQSCIYDPRHECEWQIQTFMPQPTCAAALCFDGKVVENIRFFNI